MVELLSGNEAIARGAYEAGVTVACGYPGTPSTEILENVVHFKADIYCEWAPNEKVAFEVAAGAAIAGARAIVTMKHVGLNVAADPLLTLAYVGITGGFVAIVADDPGMHSSQNEQDTRHFARFAKVPLFEPSDSQEAKDFLAMALEVSEKYHVPVILRTTTRVSHSRSLVSLCMRREKAKVNFEKNPQRFVPIPAYARVMRVKLEEKLVAMREQASIADGSESADKGFTATNNLAIASSTQEFPGIVPPATANRIEWRDRSLGIITHSIAYQYVREAWPEASVLKLGWSWPFPDKLIREFAAGVKRVLIVEELDDILEEHIKAMGIACDGKNFIPNIGELSTPQLVASRAKMEGRQITPILPVEQTKGLPSRPPVLCPGCPHRGVFYALGKFDVIVTGDIGCYSLGALPPLSRMDTILCMGAGVSMAHGMSKAGEKRKVVGIVGDSTFFHSGITGLLDVAYNRSSSVIIVVDNRTTAMTGHQDHPGTGMTLMGELTIEANIEEIAKACGIKRVYTVNPYEIDNLVKLLGEELASDEPSLIVSRYACPLHVKKPIGNQRIVQTDLCKKCRLCLKLGCPALEGRDGEAPTVNETLCAGCGLCQQVCKFGAVTVMQENA